MTPQTLDRSAISTAAKAIARHDPEVTEQQAGGILRRQLNPEFPRWMRLAAGAGYCARPVRLTGRKVEAASQGGSVLYDTRTEPDGHLLVRCGNRRASVCPPCSRTYAGDVWHLLHAGIAGGSKGIPQSVAANPMWFVTLTGPSFGRVHGEGCGRGRAGWSASGGRPGSAQVTCEHRQPQACSIRHSDSDPQIGEPLCPDCYDYSGAVTFNWHAPELWRRFTINFRREVAASLGVTDRALPGRVRVSYAKVVEFQKRGVVHFHAIVRLDGSADPSGSADAALSALDVPALLRAAVTGVAVPTLGNVAMSFGRQTDIRRVGSTNDQQEISPEAVAGYIAKYATKAAEDFGLTSGIRTSEAATLAGVRTHVARMILTAEKLSTQDSFDGLGRWLHMLGFRGHFTTKSRHFSVTLGALRATRAAFRQSRDATPQTVIPGPLQSDVTSTVVVGSWTFEGIGHLNPGDALLVARAHVDHLQALEHIREERTDAHR